MSVVFVTGARGVIGRQVVAVALQRGDTVAGLGHGSWFEGEDAPKIDAWINGGVDADNLSRLEYEIGRPDLLVHLAGGSLVGPSISSPGEDFRRTVVGSQQLLEWQRLHAPDTRVVIASSAAVYGEGHAQAIAETAKVSPTSPYGSHKAIVEMISQSYARQFGTRVALVRLFSVYGPGFRKQLLWDIASKLARGERTISLSGTGRERRDFLYVTDAAAILLDAASLADVSAPVFNGCTGRGTEIAELMALIQTRFGDAKFEFSGIKRVGDPHSLVGDASYARNAGLSASVDLVAGLNRTIDWIKGLPKREAK